MVVAATRTVCCRWWWRCTVCVRIIFHCAPSPLSLRPPTRAACPRGRRDKITLLARGRSRCLLYTRSIAGSLHRRKKKTQQSVLHITYTYRYTRRIRNCVLLQFYRMNIQRREKFVSWKFLRIDLEKSKKISKFHFFFFFL